MYLQNLAALDMHYVLLQAVGADFLNLCGFLEFGETHVHHMNSKANVHVLSLNSLELRFL